jgi:3'-phosphoadenosine 5'-phosphosulfate sulfotransferase (PAPS reductase)/FAD synthetase
MKPKLYIASCSFGKDSIATILLALEHNEPLDRVVFAEVMFDHERGISGEIPEHIEWIYNTAIPKLEGMGVKVDVVRAKTDYVTLFHKITTEKSQPQYRGKLRGFPIGRGCWGNSNLKITPIRDYYKSFSEYDIVQYVGIAIDEPERLSRLKGKVSILAKYGYTEAMAFEKAKEYGLLSPLYSTSFRGGCWFCPNQSLRSFIRLRKEHPHLWQYLNDLSLTPNLRTYAFKYEKTLQQVEKEMDDKETLNRLQYKLFN